MGENSFKLIFVVIITAGISVVGTSLYLKKSDFFSQKNILSPESAAQKAIDFINNNIRAEGLDATLLNVNEESGVYKFRLKIKDQEYTSYVTKDGKLLFPQEGISLEPVLTEVQEGVTKEIEKRDRPDVKLFVMSYCPYGLQAQKMFLPVYNLLKDKAEMGIYFINYIMHEKQEIDENLRQYCIQKEEKEKYYDYLSCFVQDGDFEKCFNQAKIDKNKMNSCISQTDKDYKITELYNDKSTWLNGRFPRFDVHSDLNEKYGVRGSPTVVINDTIVNISARSPEKFKEAICQAFNAPPAECSQILSEEIFSPGFGLSTGSFGGGQCR